MSLVYIEFRRRRPEVSHGDYAEWFGRTSGRVSGEVEPDDRLLYNLARTWRLGPGLEYVMIYDSPHHGLERFDDWQVAWTSGDPRLAEISSRSAELGWVEVAGCYRSLRQPVVEHPGPFYLEEFSVSSARDDEVIAELDRSADETPLLLAVVSLGRLAPPPGGLALWGLQGFSSLDLFVEEREHQAIIVHRASVFANLGSEVV